MKGLLGTAHFYYQVYRGSLFRLESKRIKRKPNTQKNVKKYSLLVQQFKKIEIHNAKKAHHIVMSYKLELYMRSQSDL